MAAQGSLKGRRRGQCCYPLSRHLEVSYILVGILPSPHCLPLPAPSCCLNLDTPAPTPPFFPLLKLRLLLLYPLLISCGCWCGNGSSGRYKVLGKFIC